MEQPDFKHYFEKRAAEERIAAELACDERAAQPHRELAQRYLEVATGEVQPTEGENGIEEPGLHPEFTILP